MWTQINPWGSRWLVSYLSKLGAITEDEVRLYRQSLLKFESEPIPVLPEDSFVQWSSDNVDHNLVTLDGKGTFHGMGTIASVTPSGYLQQLKNVARVAFCMPARFPTFADGNTIIILKAVDYNCGQFSTST